MIDPSWESLLRNATLGAVQTVVNQTVNVGSLAEQTLNTEIPSDQEIVLLSPVPVPNDVQVILKVVNGTWRATAKNLTLAAISVVLHIGRLL